MTARRRRSPLLLAGGGAAVIILVLVLTSGPDPSSPEGVVAAVAEALGDDDVDDVQQLACDRVDLREEFAELSVGHEPSIRVESAEVDEVVDGHSETGGMGTIKITYANGSTSTPFVFLDKVDDDTWCVAKLVYA